MSINTVPEAETSAPQRPVADAIIELRRVTKCYRIIVALDDVSLRVGAGEVRCVLSDNGAGKSTLIKIVSGLHPPDAGQLLIDGEPVRFSSPREALGRGIATVYRDLAVVGLMPVWRKFFLGSEMTSGIWPIRRLQVQRMRATTKEELAKMGIDLPDVDAPISTLSGGQRQCVAIARAVFFGARVLILDEPTAALTVKQSGVALRYVAAARDAGLGVIFIGHNPHHAYLVGDHFVLLNQGQVRLDGRRDELSLEQLTEGMAGGDQLADLEQELRGVSRS